MDYVEPVRMLPLPSYTSRDGKSSKRMRQCSHCQKKFTTTWNLARHLNSQHGGGNESSDSNDSESMDEGSRDSDESQDAEESTLSTSDIHKIQNSVALAELGDIELTRKGLTSLIAGIYQHGQKH